MRGRVVSAQKTSRQGDVPRVTERCAKFPPSTYLTDRRSAQSPIWSCVASPDGHKADDSAWRDRGYLESEVVWLRGFEYGLPVRGLLALGFISRAYADAGCPSDRLVETTVKDVCLAAYSAKGGNQYERASNLLFDLKCVAVRTRDGDDELQWGLIDWCRIVPSERAVRVRLSEQLAHLIRENKVAYWDSDTARQMLRRKKGAYAFRLWHFLEPQTLRTKWPYRVFRAALGQKDEPMHSPAIVDVLGIGHWKNRRDVMRVVRSAVKLLAEIDPRYEIRVAHAKGRGQWNLWAKRATTKDGKELSAPVRRVLSTPVACTDSPHDRVLPTPVSEPVGDATYGLSTYGKNAYGRASTGTVSSTSFETERLSDEISSSQDREARKTSTSTTWSEPVVSKTGERRADGGADEPDPAVVTKWERFLAGLASDDELWDLAERLGGECEPPLADGDSCVVHVFESTLREVERHGAAVRVLIADVYGHADALRFKHERSLSEDDLRHLGITVFHESTTDGLGYEDDGPYHLGVPA